MDGRLQDENDDQERKKQKAAQREQSHLKHLPAVGAEETQTCRGSFNTLKCVEFLKAPSSVLFSFHHTSSQTNPSEIFALIHSAHSSLLSTLTVIVID